MRNGALSGARGTIAGVEFDPVGPDTSGDRIHRMSVELRRFRADQIRRHREFDQHLASAHYRVVRANLLLSVLTRARAGTLTANWRDSLALFPLGSAAVTFPVGDHLAVREVASRGSAAWEPHSGAGWRLSLNSWFSAITATYHELEQVQRDTELANDAERAAQRESIRRLRGQLRWPQPASPPPAPARGRPQSPPLLHIEVWYRAGLAGGGDDCDWVAWLQQHDSHTARTLLERLSTPASRLQLEHLPEYWNPPPRKPSA
jgi:hypothetical protein